MKRIAIIGLGLIGKERVQAVEILNSRQKAVSIAAICDPGQKDLEIVAGALKASVCNGVEDIIAHEPDLTVVAVPHDIAPEITKKLLSAGLNVLLEKPMGRTLAEAKQIAKACLKPQQLLIAHNYRFFPGVAALLKDIKAGHFGEPVGLSLIFGHGGSPADKNSWKLNRERSGGGALIDPGIHLIDLCKLAGGELEFAGGQTWHGFWKTGIEEECRMILRGKEIPMIDLTVSVIRWRSTFRLEFFGTDGYGIVEGRGRSYGPQQYRRGRRWGWQSGKSQAESEEIVLTSSCDEVFADELESILFQKEFDSIGHPCTASEALENMEILEAWQQALKLK